MLETFLKLLTGLSDWQMYREVAAVLDAEDLAAWRRLYESNPGRDVLLWEAMRALSEVARKPRSENGGAGSRWRCREGCAPGDAPNPMRTPRV